ncbi:FMN-binding protein [Segatella baroniae]|uniref:FMN-binding domain protein n=1 Tax=Segatella baroniae F0067 TaxID=1115809 RepID=U2QJL2_9BACT|nr:FMN-binding protein [Segatella baroniae]ERK38992.1 FMN-binding domain protein [Segatella baroniae F0067]
MNKRTIGMVSGAALAVTLFASAAVNSEPITRSSDTTVVNTTEISKTVRGFKGATPVEIYIKKNKIVKVEALPNRETPQYFAKAKVLLKQFEGKTVKKAAQMEVDGVSGATYSSRALIKNVQQGLNYYKSKK